MSKPDHFELSAAATPLVRGEPPLELRALTPARIALSRTGVSVSLRHALEFSVAHAQARDAVHAALAVPSLIESLREAELQAIAVKSEARTREEYLRRPDLGRTLAAHSRSLLAASVKEPRTFGSAIGLMTIIVADGLSALAAERHALPLIEKLSRLLDDSWKLTAVVVAEQARVALGDEIGAVLGADVSVMLIGERPGLSSPDSLGAYITWAPRPGRTDAERNCVSNIRTEGLDYAKAAVRIAGYVNEARRLGLTGVGLRVDSVPESQSEGKTIGDAE